MLGLALVAALALEPFRLGGDADAADLDAAQAGVDARLGDSAEGWSAVVESSDSGARVRLTSPEGETLERDVELPSEDPDARGRELAAAIAVIIETYEPPAEPEPEPPPVEPPPPPPPKHQPRGWLGLGGRVGGGPPTAVHLDGGLTLAGGAWLVRDHVQPVAEVGWAASRSDTLKVDAARLQLGALFGGSVLRGHLWLGAGALGGAVGGFARAEQRASGWSGTVAIPLAIQGRVSMFMIEAHAGPQLLLPPLRFRGADRLLRWGLVRFFAGIRVGVTFGR